MLVACSEPHDSAIDGKLTITTHENGKTASRGYMRNAVIKVGHWTYWHDNEQKSEEGTFKNGEKEGDWILTSATGVAITVPYAAGVGPDTKWTDHGWLVDGKIDGAWIHWHENGKRKQEGTYKNGRPEGVFSHWDDKGNATKTDTYKDGKLVN